MNLFLLLNEEDVLQTNLLGSPLIKQIVTSVGNAEAVFFLYPESSDLEEQIHAIEPDVNCVPVSCKGVINQMGEALEFLRTNIPHVLKGSGCLVIPTDTLYTVPILPLFHELTSNAIVCSTSHLDRSYVLLDDEKRVLEVGKTPTELGYKTTGIYYFHNIDKLEAVCNDTDVETWDELVQSRMDKDSFVGIVKAKEEMISVGTKQDRELYEANIHQFVFSLDGAVATFTSLLYQVWLEVFAKFQLELTYPMYTFIRDHSFQEIADELGVDVDLLKTHWTTAMKTFVPTNLYTVIPGFQTLVDMIRRVGHQVYILSENPFRSEILSKLNITVDCVESLEDLPLPSEQTIVFASQSQGIQTAHTFGAKWIAGCPAYMTPKQLLDASAHVVVQNYNNPGEIITNMIYPNVQEAESLEDRYTEQLQQLFRGPVEWTADQLQGNLSKLYSVKAGDIPCIVKVLAKDSGARSDLANRVSALDREVYFYESIARYCPVRTPRLYGLLKHPKTEGLVLEDVRVSNTVNSGLDGASIDQTLQVVTELARLHSQFWDKQVHDSFPSLTPLNLSKEWLEERWDIFVKQWESVVGSSAIQQLEKTLASFEEAAKQLKEGPQTLLHGDVKASNLYFSKEAPGFLDWQFVSLGKGVQDLVFFMIESFSSKTMKQWFPVLQSYYYVKLMEFGVQGYSWDAYVSDFRAAVQYYPFFVAVWYGSMKKEELVERNFPFFFLQRYLHLEGLISTNSE